MPTIISIVSYPFLPAKLGGQKGIALFYKYFSRHYRLICITTKKNMPAAAEGYEVINTISNSPLRYINIFLFFSICKMIKKQKATHLILEHPYYGWLGILLKWASGIKLVVHMHNVEYLRWKTLHKWWWPILAWYEKHTLRNADYIFFKTDKDKDDAIVKFTLSSGKCTTITYGIEWNTIPPPAERQACKKILQQKYSLSPAINIFFFNGTLDYSPNLKALKTILEEINPLLLNTGIAYKIIICGKGLPAYMNELGAYADKNIIYAGFADDIGVYFKGADTFINPVIDGGGIKTKLVEALGYNLQVVTTVSGAIGVPLGLTGNKMKVVEDNDWKSFALALTEPDLGTDTPESFFNHFSWMNIAAKASRFIS